MCGQDSSYLNSHRSQTQVNSFSVDETYEKHPKKWLNLSDLASEGIIHHSFILSEKEVVLVVESFCFFTKAWKILLYLIPVFEGIILSHSLYPHRGIVYYSAVYIQLPL